jgi:hypothetical protein
MLGHMLIMGKKENKDQIETSAVEDLMREHGILNRVLLIYEEKYIFPRLYDIST